MADNEVQSAFKEMAIQNFIEESLKSGVSESVVKSQLIKQGISQIEAEEYIKQFQKKFVAPRRKTGKTELIIGIPVLVIGIILGILWVLNPNRGLAWGAATVCIIGIGLITRGWRKLPKHYLEDE
jgi:hypothetical protein